MRKKATHRRDMIDIRLQHHSPHRLLDRPIPKLIPRVLLPNLLEVEHGPPEMPLDKPKAPTVRQRRRARDVVAPAGDGDHKLGRRHRRVRVHLGHRRRRRRRPGRRRAGAAPTGLVDELGPRRRREPPRRREGDAGDDGGGLGEGGGQLLGEAWRVLLGCTVD